jgi:hypothetical protein
VFVSLLALPKCFNSKPVPPMWKLMLGGSQILRLEQRLDVANQDAMIMMLEVVLAMQCYMEQAFSALLLICLHHMIRRY